MVPYNTVLRKKIFCEKNQGCFFKNASKKFFFKNRLLPIESTSQKRVSPCVSKFPKKNFKKRYNGEKQVFLDINAHFPG